MSKVGTAIGEVLRSAGLGIMLGMAFGATYGFLYILIAALMQGPNSDFAFSLVGGFYGGILGAGGGAVTGLAAGLVTLICGRRFLALAWWLGGAAGGYVAARILPIGAENVWWFGLPALIGSAVGAGFGWWLQRRDRRPKRSATELSSS
jgi:hypothetical protein